MSITAQTLLRNQVCPHPYFKFHLIRMRVILMLQFKKSFFEVFNKACFISTLSPQKLEAFKYSYSSKVKTQKASRG